jgi:hypothetical protein
MSSAAGKKGSKKDGVGGGLVCAHCKKVGELDTMKRCGRCRLACYCSVACQKAHWKCGGHKKVCGKSGGSDARSDGAGASDGVGAPLQHPCPICLDNEDDDDGFGMCCSCGQMFCGSCHQSFGKHGVTNCPTCRAVPTVSGKEHVRLLRQLLARSYGRHMQCAQYTLGTCYEDGAGVAQDAGEALRWYRLAADQGYAHAQFIIAVFYENGTGVVQDLAEALRWYLMAAERGNARAQYNVGVCYENGTGVAQDAAQSARWYRLAADQGHVLAQFNVATYYLNGTGVSQDATEAVRWYRLAADQGDADALHNLGACYANGTGVVRDIAEAERWLNLAAEQGRAEADALRTSRQ